jgi:hypothetical protein
MADVGGFSACLRLPRLRPSRGSLIAAPAQSGRGPGFAIARENDPGIRCSHERIISERPAGHLLDFDADRRHRPRRRRRGRAVQLRPVLSRRPPAGTGPASCPHRRSGLFIPYSVLQVLAVLVGGGVTGLLITLKWPQVGAVLGTICAIIGAGLAILDIMRTRDGSGNSGRDRA